MVSVKNALLAIFLLSTNSWSSSFSRFGEIFAVALDISKAFDRVWHKSLVLKLPSYGLYPSLCTFVSNFLSGRSISVVADGYCSKLISVNSGVPQGSVLSPSLFLLFINDLLSITECPVHFYADDFWPFSYFRLGKKEPSVLQCLKNSVSPTTSRSLSPILRQQTTVPILYIKYFWSILIWWSQLEIFISSLGKSASAKLGVLYRLHQDFSPFQMLAIYKGLVRPCMEYASHIWGVPHTQLCWTE